MRALLTGIAIVALTAGAAYAAEGNPIGGAGPINPENLTTKKPVGSNTPTDAQGRIRRPNLDSTITAGGKPGNTEVGAAIITSSSNIKSPPAVAAGGKPGKTEAGATITASASNVKSPPNVTASGDKGKPEVEAQGRADGKGRGIAVGRQGGAF